jgi:transposase InsO family protein
LVDRRLGEKLSSIELANAIFEYIEIFHNRQRRYTALEMRTPIEYQRIR